jgi:hypothetical protein
VASIARLHDAKSAIDQDEAAELGASRKRSP